MRRQWTDWLMTTDQAQVVKRAADSVGLAVDEFVQIALEDVGDGASTLYLQNKLIRQLDWLLSGQPLERAPYLDAFWRARLIPFRKPLGSEQVDMGIEAFIRDHVSPVLEEAA
jgi:hypothetical protein